MPDEAAFVDVLTVAIDSRQTVHRHESGDVLALTQHHRGLQHDRNIDPLVRDLIYCAFNVGRAGDLRGNEFDRRRTRGRLEVMLLGRAFGSFRLPMIPTFLAPGTISRANPAAWRGVLRHKA